MNGKGTAILSGAAIIGFLFLFTSAYGAGITVRSDSADIGTIIVVSPNPGDDPVANGTALLNTLNGITSL